MGGLSKKGKRMDSIKNAFKWLVIALVFFHLFQIIFSVLYLLLTFPFFPKEGLIVHAGIFATATLTLGSLWVRERYYPAPRERIFWKVDPLFKLSIYLLISLLFASLVAAVFMILFEIALKGHLAIKAGLSWLLAITTIAFGFLWVREKFFKKRDQL